jgi:hypothetical protein
MGRDEVEPDGAGPAPDDDGSEAYGVFGEGRPRHIVGDSDEPPRRRPRKKPATGTDEARPADH